ncbi:hypothetical protein GIB67_000972 [Kingdonia uniflora]|uniref:EF-hand domain-containing protein n=1 Tax=Kingdonia uniflora TaxID=39325 RepID=A0A7J7MFP3_9MAGN|nr:hypothetical protein GIB67_000972 [Kingdonia uniflora]
MAIDDENAAKQPLLTSSLDQKRSSKRRRLRRSRSMPVDLTPLDKTTNNEFIPRALSPFAKVRYNLKRVGLFLIVYLGVGTLCFYLVKDHIRGEKTNGVLDAVYFCVVTMTTVGYGDLVPDSIASKLLACAFVFTGMALIGLILSNSADYLVEKQEFLLVKALHIRQKIGTTEIVKEVEANKVKYKFLVTLILLVVLILVGTVFLSRVEDLDIIDAFYCVCSTITTLGYGDKSFSTRIGRVFAIFWILTSTICLAQFFLYLAELSTESRQQALVKWVLTRKMTSVDLEAADLDENGTVSAAEFIVFKLKEMGKISQEDIELVMEEFEELDIDQSGTISASDLMLAQSSLT